MKKLLYFLLFCTSVSYAQQEKSKTININTSSGYSDQFAESGLRTLGSGTFLVTKVGGSGFVSLKSLEKKGNEHIEEFCNRNSYKYEIIDISKQGGGFGAFPKVSITFRIKNQDGSIFMTKEDAKKQLLELKDLLDLGIITQEEFDKKAVPLKKVLLGDF
jgi:hypothetical protein